MRVPIAILRAYRQTYPLSFPTSLIYLGALGAQKYFFLPFAVHPVKASPIWPYRCR